MSSPKPDSRPTFASAGADYYRSWNEIKGLQASRLSLVLGRAGTTGSADFLLQLHLKAGVAILKNQLSISRLWDENANNDVFASLVEASVSTFGWSVADQS